MLWLAMISLLSVSFAKDQPVSASVLEECSGDVNRDGSPERVVLLSGASANSAKILVIGKKTVVTLMDGPLEIPPRELALGCGPDGVLIGPKNSTYMVGWKWEGSRYVEFVVPMDDDY